MNNSESYVSYILNKYSKKGNWKFYELFDENGNSLPQSKKYDSLDYFVAYPDFEYYCEDKLLLLVEVKGYGEFFAGRDNNVAMKFRHYKNYLDVMYQERIDVRICFSLKFHNKRMLYWDSLNNIVEFPHDIETYTHEEFDYNLHRKVSKTEKYIFWNVLNFRTDYENLPIV